MLVTAAVSYLLIRQRAERADLDAQMDSEYSAYRTILLINKYVENTGRWPDSWRSLGADPEYAQWVHVRFDLTVREIADNKSLIYESVSTKNGFFLHNDVARSFFDSLYSTIVSKAQSVPTPGLTAKDRDHDAEEKPQPPQSPQPPPAPK